MADRRRAAWLVLLLFLALRLPFLPPSLEDLDSMNFALGVHHFDPAHHQPHPPGYPLYIALGKLSRAVTPGDASALAIWSALFGAALAWPLFVFFRRLDGETAAAIGTLLAMVNPIIWFSGARPMSDVPGFFWAAAADAVAIGALRGSPADHSRGARALVRGAALAGIAIGFRVQSAVLTLPLLAFLLAHRRRDLSPAALARIGAAFLGSVLIWAVPLVVFSGGPSAYVAAFSSQAGEDYTGVELLATHPSARHMANALDDALVRTWGVVPLAAVILALAAIGLLSLAVRRRDSAAALAWAFGPYFAFHLFWQETITTRYGIPYVAATAFLAAIGLTALSTWTRVPAGDTRGLNAVRERLRAAGRLPSERRPGRWISLGAAGIALACGVLTVPALVAHARTASPAFSALAALPASGMRTGHFAFARAFRMAGLESRERYLAPSPKHEWLSMVRYWVDQTERDRPARPVYFVAEPLRTDLALIDPFARRIAGEWRRPVAVDRVTPGVRPGDARLFVFERPLWACEEGWSLTPETAGVAAVRPPVDPVAHLWPPDANMLLWIGGRHLGRDPGPLHARVELARAPLDEFDVTPGFFLKTYTIPRERWRRIAHGHTTLRIAGVRGGEPGPVGATRLAIEQFEFQPLTRVSFAYGPGWNELEYDRKTERLQRWTSARSVIRVHNPGKSLTLRVSGFTPLQYWSSAPAHVSLAVDEVEMALQTIGTREFELEWRLPASAFTRPTLSDLVLTTDHTFVPDAIQHNGDKRTLGLKIYTLTIQ